MLRRWEPDGELYEVTVLQGAYKRWTGTVPLRCTRTKVRLIYGGELRNQIAMVVDAGGRMSSVSVEGSECLFKVAGHGVSVIVKPFQSPVFWVFCSSEKPGWRGLEGIEEGGVAVVELHPRSSELEMPSPPSRSHTSRAPPPPLSLFDPL